MAVVICMAGGLLGPVAGTGLSAAGVKPLSMTPSANGYIYTVAGSGTASSAYDNGQATDAGLSGPTGLAVDASGDLFIADTANNRVQEVPATTISRTVTFAYTGAAQSWTVPPRVSSVQLTVTGGGGGGGPGTNDVPGGAGGQVTATVAVSAGDTLQAYVGAQGNANAQVGWGYHSGGPGGDAYASNVYGGSGGGSSAVVDTSKSSLLAEAGGGGGGDLNTNAAAGGAGGNPYGATAGNHVNGTSTAYGGGGASQSAGGAGGGYSTSGGSGMVGNSGTQGLAAGTQDGGTGVGATGDGSWDNPGGGGGGYYGGGAGGLALSAGDLPVGASGGGGSSFAASTATNVSYSLAASPANGVVRVTYIAMLAGDVYTIAGSASGTAGLTGDGGPATSALLSGPKGVAVDSLGDVYIADTANNRVQEIAATTHTQWGNSLTAGDIYTVAGSATGTAGATGNGTAATSAFLSAPAGVALDAAGDLYIADTANNRVQEVFTAGGNQWAQTMTAGDIYTVAGSATGTAGATGNGTAATSAFLSAPAGVALDAAGDLYIADTANNRVQEVFTTGGNHWAQTMTADDVYTVAGSATGGSGATGDNGAATSALLHSPEGVGLDAAGDVYIADTANNRVQEVAAVPGSGSLTVGDIYTVGGSSGGSSGYSGDGGLGTSALLHGPVGVALDPSGDVFVSDTANNRVRELTANSDPTVILTDGDIYTVAGTGAAGTANDGSQATVAQLSAPGSVAVDTQGDIYIADTANNRVQEIPATTHNQWGWSAPLQAGDSYTVAGSSTGASGSSGDQGPATSALLNHPAGVAVDAQGDLYIADTANNRVQEVFAAGGNQWGQTMTAGDIYTVAGSATGSAGLSGDGGLATSALLSAPSALAFDPAGDLYIADTANNRVQEVPEATQSQPVTVPFSYTGAAQGWTVPPGVSSVQLSVAGGGGGGTVGSNASGGVGGLVTATVPVSAGDALQAYVGAQGNTNAQVGWGYHSGGPGGSAYYFYGGSGGGSSAVVDTTKSSLLVEAGGGGGGDLNINAPAGGAGGTPNGATAGNHNNGTTTGFGGGGATQSAGGAGGGYNTLSGFIGGSGTQGLAAGTQDGGTGVGAYSVSWDNSGGGGGGYYGGGAGGLGEANGLPVAASGGGGSSWATSTATNVNYSAASSLGNGAVKITYTPTFVADDVYTIAGSSSGSAGLTGDGSQAIAALLSGPKGVAIDSAGNLYIGTRPTTGSRNCQRPQVPSGARP